VPRGADFEMRLEYTPSGSLNHVLLRLRQRLVAQFKSRRAW
jgi:hypothetical protein